eukprot:3548737-Pyramimonas_sp.AAC.1
MAPTLSSDPQGPWHGHLLQPAALAEPLEACPRQHLGAEIHQVVAPCYRPDGDDLLGHQLLDPKRLRGK